MISWDQWTHTLPEVDDEETEADVIEGAVTTLMQQIETEWIATYGETGEEPDEDGPAEADARFARSYTLAL